MRLKEIVNYFESGLLPNSSAAVNLGVIVYSVNSDSSCSTAGIIVGGLGFILSSFTSVQKYFEFRHIRHVLKDKGWRDGATVDPKTHSPCQRKASRVACRETGYLGEFDELMNYRGYKWYHLLPDRYIKRFRE